MEVKYFKKKYHIVQLTEQILSSQNCFDFVRIECITYHSELMKYEYKVFILFHIFSEWVKKTEKIRNLSFNIMIVILYGNETSKINDDNDKHMMEKHSMNLFTVYFSLYLLSFSSKFLRVALFAFLMNSITM